MENQEEKKQFIGIKGAIALVGLVALFGGVMVFAGNGNGRGEANRPEDFSPQGLQTETIDFWVEFHDKLARKPNELIVVTSKADESVEIGLGCLTGEGDDVSGYHRVIVNHQGQLKGGVQKVELILPKSVGAGSRLENATFVARCYSDVDDRLYDKFTAELNESGNPTK